MPTFFLVQHGGNADEAAGQGTEKDHKEQTLHAKKGANHGKEFDVAAAHAFAFGKEVVAVGHGIEGAAAKEDAQSRLLPGDLGIEKGTGKTNEDARQADDVRNNLVMDIDKYDNQKRCYKEKVEEKGEAQAEQVHEQGGKSGHGRFYQWILERNRLAALAAFAGQGDEAQERDIIIPMQHIAAFGAVGAGEDDGAVFAWQTQDDHVEKRADNRAEECCKKKKKGFHLILLLS